MECGGEPVSGMKERVQKGRCRREGWNTLTSGTEQASSNYPVSFPFVSSLAPAAILLVMLSLRDTGPSSGGVRVSPMSYN